METTEASEVVRYCKRCRHDKPIAEFGSYSTCGPCRIKRNRYYVDHVRIPKLAREVDEGKACTRCSRVRPLEEYEYSDRKSRFYATCKACRAYTPSQKLKGKPRKKPQSCPKDEILGQNPAYLLMATRPLNQIGELL